MPTEELRALETLLATIRHATSDLLTVDGWDRWGSQNASPEQRAEMEELASRAYGARLRATDELTALVARLRRDAPGAVEAWADAHDRLLAEFIEPRRGDEKESTAVFVAEGERAGWAEVRRGDRAFVEENVHYVAIDRARYEELFGVSP